MSESKIKIKFDINPWPKSDSIPKECFEELEKGYSVEERKRLLNGTFVSLPDNVRMSEQIAEKAKVKQFIERFEKINEKAISKLLCGSKPEFKWESKQDPRVRPEHLVSDLEKIVSRAKRKQSLVNYLKDRVVVGELKKDPFPFRASTLFDVGIKYNPIIKATK